MTDLRDELLLLGRPRRFEPGETLITQGEHDDCVYLVNAGEVAVTLATPAGEVDLGLRRGGEMVGEIAVISKGARTATARAVGDCEAVEFDGPEFRAILASRPDLGSAIAESAKQQMDALTLVSVVADQYGSAGVELLPRLLVLAQWMHLEAGQILLREGDTPDSVYVLVSGRLVAETDEGCVTTAIGEIGRGEVVGEMALFDRSPRTATVRAVRASTLARIEIGAFESLLADHPRLTLAVTQTVVQRLGTRPGPRLRARSLAVVVTAPAERDGIVTAVEREVARHGPALVTSSGQIDCLLGSDGAAQADPTSIDGARLGQLLHECDTAYDHAVYVADQGPTPWTSQVLHLADTIVVISSARPDRAELQLQKSILAAGPDRPGRRWLALLHDPASARPDRAADHPLRGRVAEVHHLRRGDEGDIARLTRLGIGAGTGVVLGGGGARGFAHLGAIRALRERGVPIDRIGGTSMGAIMAALAALHGDDDQMMTVARRQFQKLFDYTVPMVSLVKAKRITAKLAEVFGEADAEDLWLPFFCVSTNLTEIRAEVHRRGHLVSAVRASIAIPGVLPPVPRGEELLVDGGVLNNLPADVMRADPSVSTVVAVDVTPPTGPRARHDYGMHVSGWQALTSAVLRRPGRYPSVGSVLMRSMIAGSEQVRSACLTDGTIDVHLSINVRGVGLLQFDRIDEVVDIGYRSARPQIDEWLSTTH